jgi:hypothetical protein
MHVGFWWECQENEATSWEDNIKTILDKMGWYGLDLSGSG